MIGKIERILARGRAAVLRMDRRERDSLVLALKNAHAPEDGGVLRFAFPEDPDRFPMFVNGAMNAVAEAALALYCSRYPGTLVVEIDGESYVKTDMPRAFLELMSKLTRMRLVIICGSEALLCHMLGCCSEFVVPGVVEVSQTEPGSTELLKSTAARLGMCFADRYALCSAARLFNQFRTTPFFHPEAFLRSIAGSKGVISAASIRSEINAADGYIRACGRLQERSGRHIPAGSGRIGFQSSSERREDLNERSA